jgi:hypothetical protein
MSSPIVEDPTQSTELNPILSERFALQRSHLLITLTFCLFFLYCNYIPIFHSDIWGHVAYGHWILEHQRLPVEDPFVSLAQGVPVMVTAWLGQVIFASAEQSFGAEWISNIFALALLASYLVLARLFYLQTGRPGLAVAGAVLVWIVGWSRHAIVRPEIFGSVCFALLFWLIVRADPFRSRDLPDNRPVSRGHRWAVWIGVPVLFTAWANLHGSFVVGFGVLGCYGLGRAIEVAMRSRNVIAVLKDRQLRRWLLLGELAIVATLLNPYGVDLLIHTFLFPGNPNLKSVVEWYPLEMVSYEGIEIGFSWILMLVVLRHSRARMTAADVLLLIVFTLAACMRVRMVTWYAPVVMVVLMPHLADVARQLKGRFSIVRAPAWWRLLAVRSFRYTLLVGLVIWMTFAFAPISHFVLGGKNRPPEHLYSGGTPREITEYLREHPPKGQIANPQWWGDWLVWNGPPDLNVFMTTNAVHAAPEQVWRDYLAISRGQDGLERRLDRYRVNTIIVHKELQARLTRYVRRMAGWTIVHEDEVGLLATRGVSLPEDDTETSAQNMSVSQRSHAKESALGR